MARRSGRRPGSPDTREAILTAARTAFAEKGYDQTSIRAIAAAAGVDPALIHHYFGTKDQLFLATMNAPFDPAEVLPRIIDGPRDETGTRLVRFILALWDSPAGAPAAALMRSAVSNEWTARLVREFVVTRILAHVIKGLNLDESEAPMRTSLVVTQIVGLVMVRYIVKVEPIASTPPAQLIAAIGPTVQHYLTGDLPGVLPHAGPSAGSSEIL
ncbi:TetR family transcriptional regulator [Dactylosporangium sp. CA-139114]|uniref:TetR/AcrR family transcriptional regulator n=1 Tax=Dactylosporangium sp. CA-139114 TaxID=3239931 RepID=UPI003D982D74